MSILITGMEMPPNCFLCKLSFMSGERLFCSAMKNEEVLRAKIDSNCPLVEIPPHGRLIDADALSEKMVICSKRIPKDSFEWDLCGEVITQLALAPTIIPATHEQEEMK